MDIYFSELFNLPIGALWTAVVGEWELDAGGHGSARLPVEKVVLHERFNNYLHDIGEFAYCSAKKPVPSTLNFLSILFHRPYFYPIHFRFIKKTQRTSSDY